jgi:hypothetical protein
VVAFHQLALGWPRLGVETRTQHWREHSDCCVVVVVRISPSSRYNLSTSPVEGVGNASRSVATFWLAMVKAVCYPPSWLMVGATPLA